MLQDIRDNSQGVVAKILIGLIVAVFALLGVGQIIGGLVATPSVAEVNGEEVTEAQLQSSLQSLLNSMGGNLDSLDQGFLQQIALGQLIEELILRQSAQNASLIISDDTIDRSIVRAPQFQINGVYDPELALRTMTVPGSSVALYRESLRQRMLLAQLATAYSRSNFVTNAELQKVAELSAQTRDFRYLSIVLGTRTLGTVISDEEIEVYYDSHQADFSEDETLVVNYVLLDKNTISAEIEVDEIELREQYEEERDAFEGSSEKRASHILFEVGVNLSEEQALQLAVEAQRRISDGEEFAALALELSSDVASAAEGGDIGYTDGSAFPEEIETALEMLSVDQVSAPVVTEFGVHLVKLTEDSTSAFQSYEEVADRIERELKSAQVELLYAERLEDLLNLAFESGDLQVISEELNLDILESEAFSRVGGSGVFSNQAVIAAAYSDDVLLEGNNSEVIEISASQAAVVRVQQFNEASILPLEQVEAEIAVLLRIEMERNAVQALGDEILLVIEAAEELDALLLANELEWINQEAMGRTAISVNRVVLNQVFAMPKPQNTPERVNLTLDNGTFVLIELNRVNLGVLASLADNEQDAMTYSMLTDLGNSDFQAFMSNLQDNADIQSRSLDEF